MCIYDYILMYIHPMVLIEVCVQELCQKIKNQLITISLKIKKYVKIVKKKVIIPDNIIYSQERRKDTVRCAQGKG